MARKKKRSPRSGAPMLQIGASRDTVKVLESLNDALAQALLMGRDAAAQEIAREIGKLGGVQGVSVAGCTFTGK